MSTDVIAHDSLVAAAVEAVKTPEGTVDEAELAARLEEMAAHTVTLHFDRELSEAEVNAIGEAAIAEHDLLALEAEAAPHVVHEEPTVVSEVIRTYDLERAGKKAVKGEDLVPAHRRMVFDPNDGTMQTIDVGEVRTPWREWTEERRVQATVDCPDCGRGLVSRGRDMICVQVPARAGLRACHPQCVVACGRPR